MKKLSLLFVLLVSASLVFGQANGLVISNKASGGAIGTAAATVDVASLFNVNQTTAGQTLTVPNLTNTTNGKTIHINNVGSTAFTLLSKTIEPGTGILLRWTGSAWNISGVGNATGGGGGSGDIDGVTAGIGLTGGGTTGTVTLNADTVSILGTLNDVAVVQADINAHEANTGNPHSVTKAQVGLGNVDNTSDANKPVSTATQTALDLKAPLASPALTGNPTAPTQTAGDNSTKIATTAYVATAVAGAGGGSGTVTTVTPGYGILSTQTPLTTSGTLRVDTSSANSIATSYDISLKVNSSSLNNQRLGTVFLDRFTSSSNYTQTQTSGSQTFNSGYVTMTGGNSQTSTNKMMYNYNGTGTLLDDYVISSKVISTSNATTYGPGLGMQINTTEENSFSVFLNTSAGASRGFIVIKNPYTNTDLITSTIGITYTNSTDTIELSIRYAVSKIIATARNISVPTQTVSGDVIPNIVTLEYEWSSVSATTPVRVSRPVVYTYGGTQNVYSLKLESDLIQNPIFTIIGDSRVYGLGPSSYKNCFANLAQIRGGYKTMVWARGGATATSLNANISELGTFFKGGHKGYVMIVVGINDAIAGRTLAQFKSDYSSLLQAILAWGGVPIVTKIVGVASTYSNQATINALVATYNAWIVTLPFKQFDQYTSLTSAGVYNANYTNDGVHDNDAGAAVEARALLSQMATLSVLYPTATYNSGVTNLLGSAHIGDILSGTVSQGTLFTAETISQNATITCGVNATTNHTSMQFCQNPTNYLQAIHYNSSYASNHTGTSIALAASSEFSNTAGGTVGGKLVANASGVFLLSGSTSTNAGIGITTAGVRFSSIANIHTAATSTLQSSGSFAAGYVAKTANYTLTIDDYLVNCTANSFTITLPTAVGITGRQYIIKNTGSSTTITIATTSSQTIDGTTPPTVTTTTPLRVQSDGANWITW